MSDPDTTEVFISYRRDRGRSDATLVWRELDHRQIDVFFDYDDITVGDKWKEKIDRAIRSPNLGAGVILMHENWFSRLNEAPDLEEDPVWQEVHGLLQRNDNDGVEICPLYFHEIDQPADHLPPSSPNAKPAIIELRSKLQKFHTVPIGQPVHHRLDRAVAEIADKVKHRSLGRQILGGLTAKEAPPQPLFRPYENRKDRRVLRRYADEQIQWGEEDVSLLTIQGQDALLTRSFDEAIQLLKRAFHDVDVDRESFVPKERAWLGHAANLLAIASLRGHRPRRLHISDATYLLHDVLIPCVNSQAQGIEIWTDLETDVSKWLYESVTSIAGLSWELLFLVWSDYFINRRVSARDNDKRREKLRNTVPALRDYVDKTASHSWVHKELKFLFENSYLDGLGDSKPEWRERQFNQLAGLPISEEEV